jgi:monoterpene epsilon-lactone hydrolase
MELSLRPRVVRPLVRATLGLPATLHMPARVERRWVAAMSTGVRTPPGLETERLDLGGVPADRFTGPWAEPGRALLYVHGGGYSSGSPHTYRGFIAALSLAARTKVYAPDYPLAPEHPYPAAPEACLCAYEALAALEGGGMALAGDSAGGGLALGLAIQLRDQGGRWPVGLALFCPWLDLSHSGASFASGAPREPILKPGRSHRNAVAYAAGIDLADPRLSPLFAESLAGLPPIHIQGAELDLLVSDADRFAERARAAGTPVEYRRFDGLWHDFQLLGEYLAESREAVDQAGQALRRMWDPEPEGAG